MPTLLQINVTVNWGSTGKIAEQIGVLAQQQGWNSYIAYGRNMNPSQNKLIKIGTMLDVYEHYFENRFLNNEGRASRRATRKFLKKVDKIKPDIIHLHNIHDHYLNFKLLFSYIKKNKIPIVWTQHDLWSMTGYCAFNLVECYKWKLQCEDCPMIPWGSLDRSSSGYNSKKNSFTSVEKMTIVPVSEWLGQQVEQSFFCKYPIRIIKNGVDTDVFKPLEPEHWDKYGLKGIKYVISVATIWSNSKGLDDFYRIRKILRDDIKIVLVGLSEDMINTLPDGIIGIPRTQSQKELAQLYSGAGALVSLSRSETFGLTIAEALSCGTPAIVYDNTAQPELVDKNTGAVIPNGNFKKVASVIEDFFVSDFKFNHTQYCRSRAISQFDKNKSFQLYVNLYNSLYESNTQ